MISGQLALSLPVPPDVHACVDWARRAEDLGYDSIWISEVGDPDPFVLAAAIAQATTRVRVGIAVSPVYVRTPAVIASAAATVAQFASARFILGVGTSSHAIIENWHGMPFRQPLTRVRETVATVRAMLAGQKLEYNGRSLRTRGFRLGVRPKTPVPIYIAALRPAMLELAGEIADGVVLNLFPPDVLPKMLSHIANGARAANKDPRSLEIVCRHQVLVTNDKPAARAAVRDHLAAYFATPVYNKFAAWCGFEEEAAMIADGFTRGDRGRTRKGMTDRFIDSISIMGSLDECRGRLSEYAAAGVTTNAVQPVASDPAVIATIVEGLAPGR